MIWDLSQCLIRWRNGELSNGEWLNILLEAQCEVIQAQLRKEGNESEAMFKAAGIIKD